MLFAGTLKRFYIYNISFDFFDPYSACVKAVLEAARSDLSTLALKLISVTKALLEKFCSQLFILASLSRLLYLNSVLFLSFNLYCLSRC